MTMRTMTTRFFVVAAAGLALVTGLNALNASSSQPRISPTLQGSGAPTVSITGGPTAGKYQFSSGEAPGLMISGRLSPDLAPGVTAGIALAVAVCTLDGVETEVPLGADCFMGGANGGSFTGYLKTAQAGCLGKNCSKVKLTYRTDDAVPVDFYVTIRTPKASLHAELDSAVSGISANDTRLITIRILGLDGELSTTFTGEVTVIPGSLRGTGVLIDGSFGMTTVAIVKGTGSMLVRAVNAVKGDTATFDILSGDRLSPSKSSLHIW